MGGRADKKRPCPCRAAAKVGRELVDVTTRECSPAINSFIWTSQSCCCAVHPPTRPVTRMNGGVQRNAGSSTWRTSGTAAAGDSVTDIERKCRKVCFVPSLCLSVGRGCGIACTWEIGRAGETRWVKKNLELVCVFGR